MKRVWLVFALVVLLVTGLAVPAASAASPPPTSTWHRLNPDQNNPAPEHERLRCIEAALEANPFPLPFNGVDWPAQDCIFAPAP